MEKSLFDQFTEFWTAFNPDPQFNNRWSATWRLWYNESDERRAELMASVANGSPHSSHSQVLLATHRKAATTNPNCTRVYAVGEYNRTSQPSSNDGPLKRDANRPRKRRSPPWLSQNILPATIPPKGTSPSIRSALNGTGYGTPTATLTIFPTTSKVWQPGRKSSPKGPTISSALPAC